MEDRKCTLMKGNSRRKRVNCSLRLECVYARYFADLARLVEAPKSATI
jgi:hypothetical protein